MLPCTGIPLINTLKNISAVARRSDNLMCLEAGWTTAVGEGGSNDLDTRLIMQALGIKPRTSRGPKQPSLD